MPLWTGPQHAPEVLFQGGGAPGGLLLGGFQQRPPQVRANSQRIYGMFKKSYFSAFAGCHRASYTGGGLEPTNNDTGHHILNITLAV